MWGILQGSQKTFASLLNAYDLRTGLLDTALACEGFAVNVYTSKFATHFCKARETLHSVKGAGPTGIRDTEGKFGLAFSNLCALCLVS